MKGGTGDLQVVGVEQPRAGFLGEEESEAADTKNPKEPHISFLALPFPHAFLFPFSFPFLPLTFPLCSFHIFSYCKEPNLKTHV